MSLTTPQVSSASDGHTASHESSRDGLAPPPPSPSPFRYDVQAGDTLAGIAPQDADHGGGAAGAQPAAGPQEAAREALPGAAAHRGGGTCRVAAAAARVHRQRMGPDAPRARRRDAARHRGALQHDGGDPAPGQPPLLPHGRAQPAVPRPAAARAAHEHGRDGAGRPRAGSRRHGLDAQRPERRRGHVHRHVGRLCAVQDAPGRAHGHLRGHLQGLQHPVLALPTDQPRPVPRGPARRARAGGAGHRARPPGGAASGQSTQHRRGQAHQADPRRRARRHPRGARAALRHDVRRNARVQPRLLPQGIPRRDPPRLQVGGEAASGCGEHRLAAAVAAAAQRIPRPRRSFQRVISASLPSRARLSFVYVEGEANMKLYQHVLALPHSVKSEGGALGLL
ncbi:hypothetical protein ON010_g13062 [Phytophthora cinnamomi]|nr:hypothetical protein ON010_g13062 [Phytophthora cinnamomi]